jgi:C4-dicarboxylate transporter, DctM subunit
MVIMGITFVTLILVGIPIAFVLGMTAVPYIIAKGLDLVIVPQRLYTGLDSFLMVSFPFFLLASELMNIGGITIRIVDFVDSALGHIRGGLAHTAVVVCMIFGGLTGMASADLAAVGGLLIPAMKKNGYRADFTAALLASSAGMGPIIPPSFLFVVYSMVVGGVSIAGLFLAGIIPGILLGVGNMAVVAIFAYKEKFPKKERAPLKKIFISFLKVLPPMSVPTVMIGGLVLGVVTATEAADIACVMALIVGLAYKELNWSKIYRRFVDIGIMSGALNFILSGATVFAFVLSSEMIPQKTAHLIATMTNDPLMVLLIINGFLLIVGCFMDPMPSMIILAPLLLPMVRNAGMDLIQFGIMITLNLVIGMLTPPVGNSLFIASTISKVSIEKISIAAWPFLISNIITLLVVTYVPWVTHFLPNIFLR